MIEIIIYSTQTVFKLGYSETRWLKYTIFQRIDCLTLDLHFGDDINVTRCVGDCRICNV